MNTDELDEVCKNNAIISQQFLGVFPADRLPEAKPGTTFICNTKSLGDKGEHWVAIAWDNNCRANYYCSFGQAPPLEILAYLDGHEWQRTNRQMQNTFSDLCGQYCVCFLYFFSQQLSMRDFTRLLRQTDNDTLVTVLFELIKL